ncbi:MAG: hypothetical protein OXN44_06205 [Acidimicrobiaceae bacterium]|nr:hypothetical protein [Acidimicrobiaceae bacterium]MDE0606072.1 hypothetical protein [Acidimicrobiaceae bacterium]
MNEHLFVTWRHPDGLIHPVGRLSRRVREESDGALPYQFVYFKHAEGLLSEGFSLLPGLPDLHRVYEAQELFPVFRKRQMPRQRPDYADYLGKLGLDVETDPFEVMARNEGRKLTDRIEVFAPPRRTDDGDLTTLFFARGIRHRDGASDAVTTLQRGDRLALKDDSKNKVNPLAIFIDTTLDEPVGWVPNYLVDTIHDLRSLSDDDALTMTVEHVNPPEVAPYMRLICRLSAPWPDNYEPFSGPEFQPIAVTDHAST